MGLKNPYIAPKLMFPQAEPKFLGEMKSWIMAGFEKQWSKKKNLSWIIP